MTPVAGVEQAGDRRIGWKFLLLALVCLPPLLSGLGAGDCEFHMEVRALQSAQETWLRMQDEPHAWLLPTWNGQPRVNKPPLAVWIDILMWTGLDRSASTVDQLVYRARLAAVFSAFMLLLALSLTGTRLKSASWGLLAAFATGTSLLFLRQVRLASYDTFFLCFGGLAVCAGLLAMAPDTTASRRTIAWICSGLCTAGAVLSKGPLAYVIATAPLLLVAGCTAPRGRNMGGALGAILLSLVLVLPWYLWILHTVPGAAEKMAVEYRAERPEAQVVWYYLGLAGLVFPWCLWLIGAVVHAARRRHWPLAWPDRAALLWFAWIFVVLSIPAAKQQRYITVILPAAGLLVASCWKRITAAQPWGRRLITGHWLLLAAASVLYGAIGGLQRPLVSRGLLKRPDLVGLPAWLYPLVAVVLLEVARRGLRRHRAGGSDAAACYCAVWMSLAATPAMYAYAHSHHARYVQRADVEEVAAVTRHEPFHYYRAPGTADYLARPDPKFLLYARRIIPPLEPGDVAAGGTGHGWLMAPREPAVDDALRNAGWTHRLDFGDGGIPRTLYRRD